MEAASKRAHILIRGDKKGLIHFCNLTKKKNVKCPASELVSFENQQTVAIHPVYLPRSNSRAGFDALIIIGSLGQVIVLSESDGYLRIRSFHLRISISTSTFLKVRAKSFIAPFHGKKHGHDLDRILTTYPSPISCHGYAIHFQDHLIFSSQGCIFSSKLDYPDMESHQLALSTPVQLFIKRDFLQFRLGSQTGHVWTFFTIDVKHTLNQYVASLSNETKKKSSTSAAENQGLLEEQLEQSFAQLCTISDQQSNLESAENRLNAQIEELNVALHILSANNQFTCKIMPILDFHQLKIENRIALHLQLTSTASSLSSHTYLDFYKHCVLVLRVVQGKTNRVYSTTMIHAQHHQENDAHGEKVCWTLKLPIYADSNLPIHISCYLAYYLPIISHLSPLSNLPAIETSGFHRIAFDQPLLTYIHLVSQPLDLLDLLDFKISKHGSNIHEMPSLHHNPFSSKWLSLLPYSSDQSIRMIVMRDSNQNRDEKKVTTMVSIIDGHTSTLNSSYTGSPRHSFDTFNRFDLRIGAPFIVGTHAKHILLDELHWPSLLGIHFDPIWHHFRELIREKHSPSTSSTTNTASGIDQDLRHLLISASNLFGQSLFIKIQLETEQYKAPQDRKTTSMMGRLRVSDVLEYPITLLTFSCPEDMTSIARAALLGRIIEIYQRAINEKSTLSLLLQPPAILTHEYFGEVFQLMSLSLESTRVAVFQVGDQLDQLIQKSREIQLSPGSCSWTLSSLPPLNHHYMIKCRSSSQSESTDIDTVFQNMVNQLRTLYSKTRMTISRDFTW